MYSDGVDGPGTIPDMASFFSSSQRPDRLWGPSGPLHNGYRLSSQPSITVFPSAESDHFPLGRVKLLFTMPSETAFLSSD
jgi:hypothetical protein